ncbi:MAG: alginate export family protein [Candidatus Magnetominusculus sp. LBB02]|nr:alginate export family protein [Candidatus Magnetominusculus sp. LBB02]
MKKLAVVVMAMVFALSFALAAYAADAPSDTAVVAKGDTKITLGGEIRFRGEYTSDRYDQLNSGTQYTSTTVTTTPLSTTSVTTNSGHIGVPGVVYPNNDHQSYFDGRVRINMDAKVSDTVEGYIELESGTGNTSDTWTWGNTGANTTTGAAGSGATGVYTSSNSKAGSVFIRQAWIQYAQPMYGVKVGHQLLILGNGLFFDHTKFGDDAIVVFVNPLKNFTIAGLDAQFRQGTVPAGTLVADTSNAYVLLAAYKGDKFNVSGDISAVNDQAYAPGTPVHLWNFGLRADGQAGPVTLRGDLELQTGNVIIPTAGVSNGRVKGWAGLAGVDWKIGQFKVTGEFAYGSGKAGNDTSSDMPQFVTSLGADQHYTYVYEYRVKSGAGAVSTGLSNTTYVKLGAAVDITKQVSAESFLYWLNASKAVALNDAGVTVGPDGVAHSPNYSRNLGWELDAKVTYAFAKNLKYWVEGGYFWTGAAYNYRTGQTTYVNATAPGPAITTTTYSFSRDNAWAARHGIQLNF